MALVEACAMAQMDPATLMAKAFMNIGDNADKIGTINFTPDLLQTLTGGIARETAGLTVDKVKDAANAVLGQKKK